MPSHTLDDAVDRLDRALASIEAVLTERDASLRRLAERKDAAVKEAIEELDALISSLDGGRNG
tara:strand:+ start:3791 stop:3979 length:189 start_codon:yes stop_codon:yes gene_type:complete